jgi:acetate kinase
MRLLVFNAGSSSLKFDVMELEASADGPPHRRVAGAFVDAADGSGRFLFRISGAAQSSAAIATPAVAIPAVAIPAVATLAEAADFALQWLANSVVHGRNLVAGAAATVHRIVHGGERFRAASVLNDAELEALASLSSMAPLHNPQALSVIAAVRRGLGVKMPVIGVFDTAYYGDLPEAAIRYAVPPRWRADFGIRRYGFHGMAHRHLCQSVREREKTLGAAARIISLQLGRGCSVTATLGGRAIATSMGFTPLEGLVMGTRSGDVDPGAILHVMERSGMSPAEMRRELNEHSGLLGLSGQTADMRELLAHEQSGDPEAALAVEVFCRRARHCVAGYMAELGGVDAIVFGGGIGENCPDIRRRIVGSLGWAGIELAPLANAACVGTEASIASASSRAAIWVIPVDEASVIARDAAALLRGLAP